MSDWATPPARSAGVSVLYFVSMKQRERAIGVAQGDVGGEAEDGAAFAVGQMPGRSRRLRQQGAVVPVRGQNLGLVPVQEAEDKRLKQAVHVKDKGECFFTAAGELQGAAVQKETGEIQQGDIGGVQAGQQVRAGIGGGDKWHKRHLVHPCPQGGQGAAVLRVAGQCPEPLHDEAKDAVQGVIRG